MKKRGLFSNNKLAWIILALCLMFVSCEGAVEGLKWEVEHFFSESVSKAQNLLKEKDGTEMELAESFWQQTTDVPEVSGSRYAYQTLPKETQNVYDEVYDTILHHKEMQYVSTLELSVLDEAYQAVMADYGELFWVSGYSYRQFTLNDAPVGMEFSPEYTLDNEETQTVQVQIDARVDEILSGITADATDYEKVKYIFEYLAGTVSYNASAPDNQNIISVFLNGETVCQGYASATQYLLTKLGIPSVIVTGTANGEAHAWNLVCMDGEYYYVDTTWGNSRYSWDDETASNRINYNYFGVTTEEIEKTHTPGEGWKLPECTATTDNYFVHEHLYYTEWQPEDIGSVFRQAWENGEREASVKFATAELYQRAVDYFLTDQNIMEYCEGITSLYYMEDRDQNILTICFS